MDKPRPVSIQYIATLFQILGYSIIDASSFPGVQVDLLMTYEIPGGLQTLVAAQYHRLRDVRYPVINGQIIDQLNLVRSVAPEVSQLIIVSDAPLDRAPKGDKKLAVLTVKELEKQALDLSENLRNRILRRPMELPQDTYATLSIDPITVYGQQLSTIDDALNRWLTISNSPIAVILGEPGEGKTTVCRRLLRDVGERFLHEPGSVRYPLMFSPPYHDLSLMGLINSQLSDVSGYSYSRNIIQRFFATVPLLIIFDDADMLSGDLEVFVKYILRTAGDTADNELSHKFVFTLRKSAMLPPIVKRSADGDAEIWIMRLNGIDSSQIRSLIKRLAARSWPINDVAVDRALQFLASERRMKAVAQNPLLVRWFAEAWSYLNFRGELEGSRGRLVNILINVMIEKFLENTKNALPQFATLEFLKEIALRMFWDDVKLVPLEDVRPSQAKVPDVKSHAIVSMEHKFTPSLIRFEKGQVGFVHTIIRDYLVAKAIVDDLRHGDPSNLLRKAISSEIIDFVVGEEPSEHLIRRWGTAYAVLPQAPSEKILSQNCTAILRALDNQVRGDEYPIFEVISLRLSNIRCFQDIKIEFSGKEIQGRQTVLVGDNGVGKSTILQCIALCALGPIVATKMTSVSRFLRKGCKTGSMEAVFRVSGLGRDGRGQEAEMVPVAMKLHANRRGFELDKSRSKGASRSTNTRTERYLRGRNEIDKEGWFLAAYGPYRNLLQSDSEFLNRSTDRMLDRVESLFNPQKVLVQPKAVGRLLMGDISELSYLDPPTTLSDGMREKILATLQRLLPTTATSQELAQFGDYIKAEETGETGISDGYKSMLSWSTHLLLELLIATNWSLAFDSVRGLLLIDEVDAHLHPRWQRVITSRLREVFPALQIVVTSHSPLVVEDLDIDRGEIVLLSETAKGVTATRDLPSVTGWRTDQILASEIFGFIIDSDPRVERVLRRTSKLLSKGSNRTAEEEKEYASLRAELQKILIPDGQTLIERDIDSEHRKAIIADIKDLEDRFFGSGHDQD